MPGNHNVRGGLGKYIRIGALPPEDSAVATESGSFFRQVPYERLTKAELTDPSKVPNSQRFSGLIMGNGWRPFTLRPLALVLFLLSTIGLIATIGGLNYTSIRQGALTFAHSDEGFSVAQVFSYRYLPQIVIVLYGVGWAVVDLDVKRLEPYFQLSKPDGASAGDSIHLHYPFDFLASATVTAAKRKHWSVFAAGTAMVLILWVITPLQSSLLTIKSVDRVIPTQFGPAAEFKTNRSKELDPHFLLDSYAVTWLDEGIGTFMTREFVALPFLPQDFYSSHSKADWGHESWIAQTTVYQTHVGCVPAKISSPGENGNGVYTFTTDNCSHSINPLPNESESETRNLMYIGHGNSSGPGQGHLWERDCTVKNIFLGVWAKSQLPPTGSTGVNVSGIFCRSSYSSSKVNITLDATNWNITSATFIGEPEPLTTGPRMINIDLFEQCLGGKTMESKDGGPIPTGVPSTHPNSKDWALSSPVGQVGYALGLEDKPFDEFYNPMVFGDAMKKTHQLLFNYAVYSLFDWQSPKLDRSYVDGMVVARNNGVVVVGVVSYLLVGFLSVVAVCIASVLLLSHDRRINLHSDPDTLATTMSLVGQNPQLLRDFEGADNCPNLRRCIKSRRYRLAPRSGEDGYRLEIVDAEGATSSESSHESSKKPHDGRGIRPWELSVGMGVGTTIYCVGFLVLLAALFRSSQVYSGLPMLSDHETVVRFIYSFIPTAAATLVEPVWVVVTRYLALYQPWTELSRGHASSAASLGLKYNNLPPALIAPRAFRRRHYILSLASTVVLASNGLAVALGGLFESGLRETAIPVTFESLLSSNIDFQNNRTISAGGGKSAQDDENRRLVSNTNLPSYTPPPPWVFDDIYFLPFQLDTKVKNVSDLWSAKTQGLGVDLTCTLLEGDVYGQQSWAGLSDDLASRPAVALNVTVPMPNGREIRCNSPILRFTPSSLLETGAGNFSGEYLYDLGPADRTDKEAVDFCNSLLVVGWSRGNITVRRPGRNNSTVSYANMRSYVNTTILCMQKIASAQFNVVVDNRGRVKEYRNLTEFTYDNPSLFNYSTTAANFKAQLSSIILSNSPRRMHNNKDCRTFPFSLINSTVNGSLCDWRNPPPQFKDAHREFRGFYNWFTAIAIAQNAQRIFHNATKAGGKNPQTHGKRIFLQNRVSMDPPMFYMAIALLGFSALTSVATFSARPKRFLPRLPDTLAAEIGFFYASEALEDTAGTAHMSSRMRERHLAKLGWEYGYGKFKGKDGKLHLGVERMGRIDDLKEAPEALPLGEAEAVKEQEKVLGKRDAFG